EIIERGLCHLVVLRRFGARNILLHVGGREIQPRGGKARIELARRLEALDGFRVLRVGERLHALVELIARLELIAARGKDGKRGHGQDQYRFAHYCPLSTLAVIRPTLSMPAPCAMSIALATH